MTSQSSDSKIEAAVERLRTAAAGSTAFNDFDLLNDEVYKQFHPFGMMGSDQIVGLRRMPPGGRAEPMYGITGKEQVVLDVIGPGKFLGFIPRGLPHHLPADYGWWHLNGTEEFYFTVPLIDGDVCLVLLEGNPAERVDTFAWYCQQCCEPLYARECPVGQIGLEGYWRIETEAVAEFNAEAKLRTCGSCKIVHPPAYSFFDAQDQKLW